MKLRIITLVLLMISINNAFGQFDLMGSTMIHSLAEIDFSATFNPYKMELYQYSHRNSGSYFSQYNLRSKKFDKINFEDKLNNFTNGMIRNGYYLNFIGFVNDSIAILTKDKTDYGEGVYISDSEKKMKTVKTIYRYNYSKKLLIDSIRIIYEAKFLNNLIQGVSKEFLNEQNSLYVFIIDDMVFHWNYKKKMLKTSMVSFKPKKIIENSGNSFFLVSQKDSVSIMEYFFDKDGVLKQGEKITNSLIYENKYFGDNTIYNVDGKFLVFSDNFSLVYRYMKKVTISKGTIHPNKERVFILQGDSLLDVSNFFLSKHCKFSDIKNGIKFGKFKIPTYYNNAIFEYEFGFSKNGLIETKRNKKIVTGAMENGFLFGNSNDLWIIKYISSSMKKVGGWNGVIYSPNNLLEPIFFSSLKISEIKNINYKTNIALVQGPKGINELNLINGELNENIINIGNDRTIKPKNIIRNLSQSESPYDEKKIEIGYYDKINLTQNSDYLFTKKSSLDTIYYSREYDIDYYYSENSSELFILDKQKITSIDINTKKKIEYPRTIFSSLNKAHFIYTKDSSEIIMEYVKLFPIKRGTFLYDYISFKGLEPDLFEKSVIVDDIELIELEKTGSLNFEIHGKSINETKGNFNELIKKNSKDLITPIRLDKKAGIRYFYFFNSEKLDYTLGRTNAIILPKGLKLNIDTSKLENFLFYELDNKSLNTFTIDLARILNDLTKYKEVNLIFLYEGDIVEWKSNSYLKTLSYNNRYNIFHNREYIINIEKLIALFRSGYLNFKSTTLVTVSNGNLENYVNKDFSYFSNKGNNIYLLNLFLDGIGGAIEKDFVEVFLSLIDKQKSLNQMLEMTKDVILSENKKIKIIEKGGINSTIKLN